jgi:hypothetical protein
MPYPQVSAQQQPGAPPTPSRSSEADASGRSGDAWIPGVSTAMRLLNGGLTRGYVMGRQRTLKPFLDKLVQDVSLGSAFHRWPAISSMETVYFASHTACYLSPTQLQPPLIAVITYSNPGTKGRQFCIVPISLSIFAPSQPVLKRDRYG